MFQGLFAGILFFFPAKASDLSLGDDSRWVNPSERRRCCDSLPSSLVRRVKAIGAQVMHNTEQRLTIILIQPATGGRPARPSMARPGPADWRETIILQFAETFQRSMLSH